MFGGCPMPQPRRLKPPEPLSGSHDCPNCGFPLLLSIIEPASQDGYDRRTFECAVCKYTETVDVKFR